MCIPRVMCIACIPPRSANATLHTPVLHAAGYRYSYALEPADARECQGEPDEGFQGAGAARSLAQAPSKPHTDAHPDTGQTVCCGAAWVGAAQARAARLRRRGALRQEH